MPAAEGLTVYEPASSEPAVVVGALVAVVAVVGAIVEGVIEVVAVAAVVIAIGSSSCDSSSTPQRQLTLQLHLASTL